VQAFVRRDTHNKCHNRKRFYLKGFTSKVLNEEDY
jgi:hypothetical protein